MQASSPDHVLVSPGNGCEGTVISSQSLFWTGDIMHYKGNPQVTSDKNIISVIVEDLKHCVTLLNQVNQEKY